MKRFRNTLDPAEGAASPLPRPPEKRFGQVGRLAQEGLLSMATPLLGKPPRPPPGIDFGRVPRDLPSCRPPAPRRRSSRGETGGATLLCWSPGALSPPLRPPQLSAERPPCLDLSAVMGDKERTLDGSGPPTFSTMLGSAEMPTSAGTHGHPSNHSSASYSIESPEAPGRAGAKRAGPASGHGECRAGPGLPPVARLRPAPGPPPASPCPALGPTPARRAAGPPGSSAGGPAPRVRPPVPPGAPAPTPAPPLPLRAEHPTWGARGTAGPEGPSPGLQRVGSLPVDARAGRPAKSPTVDMITGMSGMGFYSPAGGVAGAAASEPPGRPPQPWGPSPWPSASPAGGSQPSQGGVFGSQLEMCSDTTLHTSGSGGFGSFSQGCPPGGLVPAARGPAPAPPGGSPRGPRFAGEGAGARDADPSRLPIVFIHGIGVGLLPYMRAVRILAWAFPGHPILTQVTD